MSPTDFSSLPLELVVNVLHQVGSPRDLLALIETSKSLNQAFQYSRCSILEAVIRNAMPHDSIEFAVTACKAAQICRLRGNVIDDMSPEFQDARRAFLNDHPEGRTSQTHSLCDEELLLSLYRLWWVADHFIVLYVRQAFRSARCSIPRLKEHSNRELSSVEQGSVQRSFYTFETYRRLFSGTLTYTPCEGSVMDFFSNGIEDFLEALSLPERERLLSVHEFLFDFSQTLLYDTRNHIVREVSDIAFAYAAKPDATPIKVEPLLTLAQNLKDLTLDLFEYDTDHNRTRNSYFVGRGLPFLRWLSKLTLNDRISIFIEYDGAECVWSLFRAVCASEGNSFPHSYSPCCPSEKHDAGLCQSETGWMWAEKHWLTSDEYHGLHDGLRKRASLRRMGFVFWDADRLIDDWGLLDVEPSMLQLRHREMDDDDPTPTWAVSVAEVFKDIPVTLEMFNDDPGGVFERLEPCLYVDKNDRVPLPFSAREAEDWFVEY